MSWYMLRFVVENLLFAAGFSYLIWRTYRSSESNIAALEKFTRDRKIGIAIALPALLLCVPHAKLVSPGFLLPLLWPLAVVLPVLCYCYIDFYAARAIAGALIIFAYDAIHFAYELKLPGSGVITVAAWLAGFAGIWYSGKPVALRDTWRAGAKSERIRWCVCGAMTLPVLIALESLIAFLAR